MRVCGANMLMLGRSFRFCMLPPQSECHNLGLLTVVAFPSPFDTLYARIFSNFISRVWPRASAVAERLWTGDVVVGGAKETISSRIHRFRCLMVRLGFAAAPTGPGVCPHEVPYLMAQRRKSFVVDASSHVLH